MVVVGHAVPIPHFGVVLEWDAMNELVDNMKKHQIKFEIEPYTRFEGLPGEQKTMVRLRVFPNHHSQIPHLNITLFSFSLIHLEMLWSSSRLKILNSSCLKRDEFAFL